MTHFYLVLSLFYFNHSVGWQALPGKRRHLFWKDQSQHWSNWITTYAEPPHYKISGGCRQIVSSKPLKGCCDGFETRPSLFTDPLSVDQSLLRNLQLLINWPWTDLSHVQEDESRHIKFKVVISRSRVALILVTSVALSGHYCGHFFPHTSQEITCQTETLFPVKVKCFKM